MDLKIYAKTKTAASFSVKKIALLLAVVLTCSSAFAQLTGTGLHLLYQPSPAPGVRNMVVIPDNDNGSLNITGNLTLEAWINYSSISGTQDVISKSSNVASNGFIFPRTADGWRNVQFLLYVNSAWRVLTVPYSGATHAKRNQWHHLAATYDGYYMKIFIDGVEAGSMAMSGSIMVNTNPLTLGGQTGYANEYFTGSIDDVRIWNRALSPCEIANNKNCELTGSEPGLAAYYKLNQGLVGVPNLLETTVYDASPNGNNGTLSGFLLAGTTSNWTQGAIAAGNYCSVYTPVQAVAGSVSSSVAVGDNIELTASGGDSYVWVGPNGFNSTEQNPVIGNANFASAGIYTVTVTKNGCSATASTTISVSNRAKALLFDGVDDEVRIPNAANLNSNTFTLETWMYPTSGFPATQSVVSKATVSPDKGFIFPRTDDGWLNCAVWLTINGNWQSYSVPFPGLNMWTHVAATYDGFDLRIFINGNLVKTENLPGTVNWSNADMILGGQPGYVQHYKGKLDEMRIWNRALTECEIQNNITCELNGANNGIANLNGLSAYYRFNQGLQDINNSSVTTLVDSSGHANNGTLLHFDLTDLVSNWTSGGSVNNATCTPFQPMIVTAGNNGPVVEVGQPIQLTASAGSSWSWTGPNGFTSTEQNPVINNSTTAMSGVYSVAVSGSGCTTTANTKLQVAYKAYSLNFDGVDDQITVPAKPSLNMSSQLTLEAWLYPTDNSRPVQDVMSKSTLNINNGYIFPRTDNAWASYTFYLHVNGEWNILAAPYPGLNQWHHVAATYDGFYMRIYLDGVLSASKEVYGTITQNTNDLVLGQQPGFSEYYGGYVDEARVWNRALSQCEIINNMKCELIPAQQPNMVAYYKFNQGFGDADNTAITTLTDATSEANHGLLQNFTLQGLTSNWATYYSSEKGSNTCELYNEPPVIAQANGTNFAIGSTVKLFSAGGTQYFWDGPNSFSATGQTATLNNAQLPSSGTYTVTVPFVNCVVNKSVRINVTNVAPIIASGPLSFCPSSSVTLTTPNTGSAYQWYNNEILIPGATAASYIATQTGNYAVGVTNNDKVTISETVPVTVEDHIAPIPDLAQLPTLNLEVPATVTVFPTATDNCVGTITATTTSQLSFNNEGTYTILWKYDDGHGNTATQGQNVVVIQTHDIQPPVLSVPSAITLNATACGAVANFTATATDDFEEPVTITYSQNPGTEFAIGTTTVTVTAIDGAGNTTTGTFTVTVVDNTVPVLVLPADINATSGTGINVGTATATDNCGTPVVTHSNIPTTFPLGVTNITWTATDAAGNAASGVQKVTVTDVTAPVLNGVPADATADCGVLPSVPTVTATDDFDQNPVVIMTSSTSGNTVTRTWTATDASGNTTTATQMITVIAPPAAPVVTATDNCGSTTLMATGTNLVWSNGATSSSITVNNAGTYTVTQTVDGCTSVAASVVAAPKAIPSAPVVSVADNCGNSVLTATGTNLMWSNEATSSSITVNTGGTYTVTQTVGGCTSAAASVVAAPKAIPSAPVVGVADNCGNSVLTATGTNLVWSNGATSSSITVNNAGTYTVTQTVDGCTSVAASVVAAPKAIPSAPVVSVVDNCGNSVLTATGTNLVWSNGATSSSITINNAGTYTVTQTVGGCTSAAASVVAAPKAIPSAPVVSVADNCGNSVLTATGTNLVWSTGATTSSITVSNGGSYTVTQTINGCTSAATSVVAAPKAIPAKPVVTVVNNCGNTVLSATAAGSLAWSNGATTPSITVTSNGAYQVTTTVNGCTSPAAVTNVTIATPAVVAAITGNTAVTAGATTQLSNSTSGGTWSSANTNIATVNANGLVTGITAGTTAISYVVTTPQGCSTTVSATVTVNPSCIAPVLTSSNVLASTPTGATACNGPVTYTVNATATPAATLSYTFTGATTGSGNGTGSGAVFNTGVTTVVVKAVNACGSATTTFTVTLKDGTAPVPNVVILPTITGQCSASLATTSGNNNNNNYSGNYNCSNKKSWSCDDNCRCCRYSCHCRRGDCDCRDYSYRSRNIISMLFSFLGNCYGWGGDDDDDHGCDHDDDTDGGSQVSNAPKATDNCKGTIVGTTTDPLTYNSQGTYTIHWKYDDGNGNVTIQEQTVIVKDDTKPVLDVPNNITLYCGSSVTPSGCNSSATATDNCSSVNITYSDVNNGSTIERTWKATDAAGNFSTGVQIITIRDNTRPYISDIADKTVGCSSSTDPSVTGRPTATDACSEVTLSYTDYVNGNVITRTWKATDAAGNYSTSTQKITQGSSFNVNVSSVPTSNTYTGGISTNLYLGYGAQSTKLQVCQLPSSGAPYSYSWSGNAVNKLNSTSSSAPTFTPSAAGTYTFVVTVTNKYGCSSTDYITICVTDIRVPGSNGNKVYVCHRTSSRKNPTVTIEVSINAVAAHLTHGNCSRDDDDDDRLGSCEQSPCGTTGAFASTNTPVTQGGVTAEGAVSTKETTKSVAATAEELKVVVMPNPSTTFFTLKFASASQAPLNLRVLDGTGRVIDAKSRINANSTLQIGHNYTSGTYYAEITQGAQRKVIQLIKARG